MKGRSRTDIHCPPLFGLYSLLKNNGELTAAGHPDALTDGEMGAFNLLMQNIAEQKNYHMAILTEPEKMVGASIASMYCKVDWLDDTLIRLSVRMWGVLRSWLR
mgnify:CR=1 FL=1